MDRHTIGAWMVVVPLIVIIVGGLVAATLQSPKLGLFLIGVLIYVGIAFYLLRD